MEFFMKDLYMIRTTQKKPVDKERLSQIISKFEKTESKVSLLDEISKKMEILEQKSAQKLKEKPKPQTNLFEPKQTQSLLIDDDDEVIPKPKKTKTTKKVTIKETPKVHIEKHESLFVPTESISKAKTGSFIAAIAETQKKNGNQENHYVPQESVPIKTFNDKTEQEQIIKPQEQIEINPNIYDLIIPPEMRAQGLNATIVKNNPKIFTELKQKYIAKKRQDEYERKQLEAKQKLELEKQLYEERTRRKELEYQQYVWYKTLQERNQAQNAKPQSPPLYNNQPQQTPSQRHFQEPIQESLHSPLKRSQPSQRLEQLPSQRLEQIPSQRLFQEPIQESLRKPLKESHNASQDIFDKQRPMKSQQDSNQKSSSTKKGVTVQIVKEGQEPTQPGIQLPKDDKMSHFKMYVVEIVKKTSRKYNIPGDAVTKIINRVNTCENTDDVKMLINRYKAFILSYIKTQKAKNPENINNPNIPLKPHNNPSNNPSKNPSKPQKQQPQIIYKTRKQLKNPNWEKKLMKETNNIKNNKSYRNYVSKSRTIDKELRVSPKLDCPYTNPEIKPINEIMDNLENKKIISINDRFKKVPQDIYEWLYKITDDGCVKIVY